MRGVFDEREEAPVQVRRDTELTLGSGMLLVLGLGLAVLCGLCFGMGYMVGHRGASAPVEAPSQSVAGSQPAASAIGKPSATLQAAQASTPSPVDSSQNPTDGAAAAPGVAAPASGPEPVPSSAVPNQPQIRPALTPAVASNPSAQPVAATMNTVRPAFAPAAESVAASSGSMMVQIAAVSNAEDAQVLTNALRKRGYAVTARREPADNLIHVRVGPFATPAEANSWKMKLLNDGYNAIVQP